MSARTGLFFAVALTMMAPVAYACGAIMIESDGAVKWSPVPANLPKGGEISILMGDPAKPGPFTLRLKLPANYVIAPHTHATDEIVTVLSGSLVHDMGETIEKHRGQTFKTGAFLSLPAKMPHSLWTTGEAAVIQVTGTGPFGLDYVNPADDPSKTGRSEQ